MNVTTSTESHRQRRRDLLALVQTAVANPVLAYGAILALQMRVIWNVWQYKDLTGGDTSSYFLDAVSWAHGLQNDIVWSPLYTDFFGTITAVFNGKVYDATMLHRVAIIVVAALLVLRLMRTLLGPAMGLLVTVWWVILPANFNVLYEVHLFGLIPLLIAALVVARAPDRKALGIGLAILVGTTLLLRNELLVATVLFAAAIVVHEIRGRAKRPAGIRVYLRSFGVPLAIVALLAGALYWRSFDQGHEVTEALRAKQGLNLCQSYAFNYQQRHPTKFVGNAFTECQPLMKQVFGRDEPSFTQAALYEPRAIGAYALWNARLLGSGVQVALFNATATGDQPDYPPVETHRTYALMLTVILLAVLLLGGWAITRELKTGRRDELNRYRWAIAMLTAVALTTVLVALTERPRPEYMYGMTVAIIALAGASLAALLRRLRVTRFVAPVALGLTLVLVVAAPSYYHKGPRPLHDAVDRLWTVRSQLDKRGRVLVTGSYNYEICSYLAQTHLRYCTSPSWQALQVQIASGVPIRRLLNHVKATAIYAESLLLSDPSMAKLVAAPKEYGWRQVEGGVGEGGPWHVLVRAS
jgi:hypothetical protein